MIQPPPKLSKILPEDYFRIRDFEYVQPLYDLAFLLEITSLSKNIEIPKYRTFSLWRAAYSLDGYGTTIDRWLDGLIDDTDLDYVPSSRIKDYLLTIRHTGTLPELKSLQNKRSLRSLRLRSLRGLGPKQIASALSSNKPDADWLRQAVLSTGLESQHIIDVFDGIHAGSWQSGHVIPPLMRFLKAMGAHLQEPHSWQISELVDPLNPINVSISIALNSDTQTSNLIKKALKKQRLYKSLPSIKEGFFGIRHQQGWKIYFQNKQSSTKGDDLFSLVQKLDPIGATLTGLLKSDLHMHTAWSDGSASVNSMAEASVARGLEYIAITDHSRSCKLQGGLTPILWLRQAGALTLAQPVCPVLHGIEVDILKDGSLDMPVSLLTASDLVIGSVHSNWSNDPHQNTNRLLRAIQTGCIDILAHPTSAVIGKPGIPDYVRKPSLVFWDQVFKACALWRVALEFNCFPSRLDLPLFLLKQAIEAGCAISLGSDAHARSHLINIHFGEFLLKELKEPTVLNKFSYLDLKYWIKQSRTERGKLPRETGPLLQGELKFGLELKPEKALLLAKIQPPQKIPNGCRVVGIDLTAGAKETGVAVIDGFETKTASLNSDEEIIEYVRQQNPEIVSIDSPLGLPGGKETIDPKAGIVRVAEHDLASVGIPAYPALIDSMEKLTLRGIRLRKAIEQLPTAPRVIESYPGAAQDILSIPRKQKSLDLLREGLQRLGLKGSGLKTKSHDEMDAITSALVGRYFETGNYEPMGIPSEAQLIVPKVSPLVFAKNPAICLAGKTGAGKSVVARYLSTFYGFKWIRTRDLIRELLINDINAPAEKRIYPKISNEELISESHLREFGAIILDQYHQVPLRNLLSDKIANIRQPLVIDSIRDTVDIDHSKIPKQPVLVWFVECTDNLIQTRLINRNKWGEKGNKMASPVDRKAPRIRELANNIISNLTSLEDLRWRVDDTLFSHIQIESS